MRTRSFWRVLVGVAALSMTGLVALPAPADTTGDPGDAVLNVDLNDSTAGGTYNQAFTKVYGNATPDGTPVYVYVPEGAIGDPSVDSMNPQFDPNPADAFVPCPDTPQSDFLITQDQINTLGDELANHIVAIDEAHYGLIGEAMPGEPATKALVMLVYNVQDDNYYDCDESTYTAGYFAPEYINQAGMNVIVIDAYDWANRIGEDGGHLYEGVIAHELEHLLMNYSDAGELSWVDEGLADFAIFLNGYDVGGSHLAYQQVFHRETSLTRWGGGLENYGASYTFFQYLWERAGGNGDGTYDADGAYDGVAGDWLINAIFHEQKDGMTGVQQAIDDFNTAGGSLPDADELFRDWSLAVKYDLEGDDIADIKAVDMGPDSWGYTIDIANYVFWDGRGQYNGAMPDAKMANHPDAASQSALPFGVSYESFRNPGPRFDLTFSGPATSQVAPHSPPEHWYGGYESQSDNVLDVDYGGGATIDFWTWYFIEEGWDYGFVEALVGGDWVTIPLRDDQGGTVTTNDDPHDNNEEGNGLTGTSGGAYFVDEPAYIHLTGDLPDGTTDVRFRYSTDAAYLDTGWFVDDVNIDGDPATVEPGDWTSTSGIQNNSWTVQIVTNPVCDLGVDDAAAGIDHEVIEFGPYTAYRFTDAGDLHLERLNGDCLHQGRFEVIVSNLPSGDLSFLDAAYDFNVTNTGKQKGKFK